LKVVCDASTLIALARIGQLDILRQAGAQVVIPTAVYEEVVVKGASKPGADEIRQASWVETREVSDRDVVAQFRTVLGAGESEVIALAKEHGADLILLDDQDARGTAIAEGLNVVGLLAFLVLAKEEGRHWWRIVWKALNSLVRHGISRRGHADFVNSPPVSGDYPSGPAAFGCAQTSRLFHQR
jgi:predicted nucleic acid-binding protein